MAVGDRDGRGYSTWLDGGAPRARHHVDCCISTTTAFNSLGQGAVNVRVRDMEPTHRRDCHPRWRRTHPATGSYRVTADAQTDNAA